jgi:hypothetical protein
LTIDQHTDHIATGQLSRHSNRPDVFYFFSTAHFLKTILASRTSGTFGFAPTHKANASQNQKSHFLPTHRRINVIKKVTLTDINFR